jgi:hypothetical protein
MSACATTPKGRMMNSIIFFIITGCLFLFIIFFFEFTGFLIETITQEDILDASES